MHNAHFNEWITPSYSNLLLVFQMLFSAQMNMAKQQNNRGTITETRKNTSEESFEFGLLDFFYFALFAHSGLHVSAPIPLPFDSSIFQLPSNSMQLAHKFIFCWSESLPSVSDATVVVVNSVFEKSVEVDGISIDWLIEGAIDDSIRRSFSGLILEDRFAEINVLLWWG